MIRLSSIHRFKLKERIFYFHTMEECNEFINVFKENSCNIVWGEPREIPDHVKLKPMDMAELDKPAIERAQKALSWGFNITEEQHSFFTG